MIKRIRVKEGRDGEFTVVPELEGARGRRLVRNDLKSQGRDVREAVLAMLGQLPVEERPPTLEDIR